MQNLLDSVSCRFVKRGCKHGDKNLFTAQYQRVNRSHGTKILRCFPHCCPHHVARSYCGATVELRVDAPDLPYDPALLCVYARFREADTEPALHVYDSVPHAFIAKAVQSPTQTKAPWIAARASYDASKKRSAYTFEINASKRWYYPWQSGKNSAKRATQHVLEAFVFVKSQGHDVLHCIGRVGSPGFTLVSFRRVGGIGEFDAAAGLSTSPKATPVSRSPVSTGISQGLYSREGAGPAVQRILPQSAPKRPCTVNPDSFSEQLSVVFAAAEQFSVGAAKQLIPQWSALSESPQAAMSDEDAAISPTKASAFVLSDPVETAAHVVWWLTLDKEAGIVWKDHVRRAASVLFREADLHACFNRWVHWLEVHLDRFLAVLGHGSLQRLIKSLPAQRQQRTNAAPHCYGWHRFVAQARELVVGVSLSRGRGRDSGDLAQPWVCPLDRISVAFSGGSTPLASHSNTAHGFSLGALPISVLFHFWRQLSSVHLDLDTQTSPNVLHIRSSHVNETGGWPETQLLLDNRHRWFNAMPHGESTLLSSGSGGGGGSFGDYTASYRRDGSIEIALFTWDKATSTPGGDDDDRASHSASRWVWRFRPQDLSGRSMDIDLKVHVAELSAQPP